MAIWTQDIAHPFDREKRLQAKEDSARKLGKDVKAEDFALKREWGTDDRSQILAGMAAKDLREFQDDPYKASGVDQRQQDTTMRALQGVRQASANQLNQQLGLGSMRGQATDTAEATAAAARAYGQTDAEDRGTVATMADQMVTAHGENIMARFRGDQSTGSTGMDPRWRDALLATGSDLANDVDFV